MKNMIIMMYRDGGDVPWSESVYKLAKAEKDSSGNLFIYDYYIHIVYILPLIKKRLLIQMQILVICIQII